MRSSFWNSSNFSSYLISSHLEFTMLKEKQQQQQPKTYNRKKKGEKKGTHPNDLFFLSGQGWRKGRGIIKRRHFGTSNCNDIWGRINLNSPQNSISDPNLSTDRTPVKPRCKNGRRNKSCPSPAGTWFIFHQQIKKSYVFWKCKVCLRISSIPLVQSLDAKLN